MGKTYELFVHYKQGDDLNHFLAETKTVSEGLKMWSEGMKANSELLAKLAELLEGKDVECHADTHYIGFQGDDEVLGKAVEMELLQLVEFCDECEQDIEDCDCEDECDCGEDCDCEEDVIEEEDEEKSSPCGCCCSEK